MPRIAYPDPEQLTELQKKSTGSLNVGKMTAWFPDHMLAPFSAWGLAVLTTPTLDSHLRELAILRVGHLSNSAYELHQHEQYARKLGLADDKIAATAQGPDAAVWTSTEKRVLAFVDDIVLRVRPSDQTLADLREELPVPAIFCLIAAVGQYMMICRILETTGVELDPDGVVVDPRG